MKTGGIALFLGAAEVRSALERASHAGRGILAGSAGGGGGGSAGGGGGGSAGGGGGGSAGGGCTV